VTNSSFVLAIGCLLGHTTTVPRQKSTAPDDAPERLTALSHQLQSVISRLQDRLQPGQVEEGTTLEASGLAPSAGAGVCSRCDKRWKETWAVLDSCKDAALLVLTKEKEGAESLRGLCRKFCLGSREGAVTLVCEGLNPTTTFEC
jgi:hypothetical protein